MIARLRALARALRGTPAEAAPAPYIWAYTKSGTTVRGILVGRDTEAYTLDHADVAPEGASGFRQVRGRVRVPVQNVDYYVQSAPEGRAR